MELIWIEDFLALAATRNFTQAAALCATTQPAFSRRLKRLEDWLGCALVDREARPVALTREGEAFLPRAQRLREAMLDARRAVQSLASHYALPYRLYTTNTVAIGALPALVKMADIEHYSLVVASMSGCVEAVKSGLASSAFVPMFEDDDFGPLLQAADVAQDKLVLMKSRELKTPITCENGLLAGPLLMYAPQTGYGKQVAACLAHRKVALANQPLCESASAEALAAQVRAGLGAAWIPESLATPDIIPCFPSPFFDIAYRIALLTRRKTDAAIPVSEQD